MLYSTLPVCSLWFCRVLFCSALGARGTLKVAFLPLQRCVSNMSLSSPGRSACVRLRRLGRKAVGNFMTSWPQPSPSSRFQLAEEARRTRASVRSDDLKHQSTSKPKRCNAFHGLHICAIDTLVSDYGLRQELDSYFNHRDGFSLTYRIPPILSTTMSDAQSPDTLACELIDVIAYHKGWEEALTMIEEINAWKGGISAAAMEDLKAAYGRLPQGSLDGEAAKVKSELEKLGAGSESARATNDAGRQNGRRTGRVPPSTVTVFGTGDPFRPSRTLSAIGSMKSRKKGYSTLPGVSTVRDL